MIKEFIDKLFNKIGYISKKEIKINEDRKKKLFYTKLDVEKIFYSVTFKKMKTNEIFYRFYINLNINNKTFAIKKIDTDDYEYGLICANEICEMLNDKNY